MNRTESRSLLDRHVQRYRALGYAALREMVLRGENDTFEENGASGVRYQFDMLFFWDGEPEKDIRVICHVYLDPRGEHVTEDFILSPDEKFVDE